jgi:hypothetical protein
MHSLGRSKVHSNQGGSMRKRFAAIASRGCGHILSKGARVARSPFVHGVLIGSAIAALVFLAM